MTKIFLDGGTHLGGGIKSISKKEGINKDWKIYSWEANPHTYNKNLNDTKKYDRFNIVFFNEALSTYNGVINVQIQEQRDKHSKELVNTGQGTTVLAVEDFRDPTAKAKEILKSVEIPCIDFVEWISKNTNDSDEILIKLDIEGAEYTLLEKLIESNQLYKIKKIYVEWHSYALKNPEEYNKRQLHIEQVLKDNNVEVISWV